MTDFSCTKMLYALVRSWSPTGAALILSLTHLTEVQAQDLTFTTNDGTITITGYIGKGGNVTIPGEINGLPVNVIAGNAFEFSSITNVTLPDSVTNIGFQAFAYCQNLESIEVGSLNKSYTSVEGVLLDKQETTLVQCPSGKTGTFIIPNGVTD